MLGRLFRSFAASLVPGGGYFVAGWSPSTALALYWVDNLLGGWLVRIMSVFPKQKGETFEEYWRRTHRTEEEKAALDEQVERIKR